MINLKRSTGSNPDFIKMVDLLDADFAIRDGDDHAFYSQYNKLDDIHHVILIYEGSEVVACGAIKAFDEHAMEVKRMYVVPVHRKKGIASKLLKALEGWILELGKTKSILETGKRQPEAISLYKKSGYHIIDNYGQYQGVENSVCFEKVLT